MLIIDSPLSPVSTQAEVQAWIDKLEAKRKATRSPSERAQLTRELQLARGWLRDGS